MWRLLLDVGHAMKRAQNAERRQATFAGGAPEHRCLQPQGRRL